MKNNEIIFMTVNTFNQSIQYVSVNLIVFTFLFTLLHYVTGSLIS